MEQKPTDNKPATPEEKGQASQQQHKQEKAQQGPRDDQAPQSSQK